MSLGRHTEKAVVKYQKMGASLHKEAMEYRDDFVTDNPAAAIHFQRVSAIEYATARKLR